MKTIYLVDVPGYGLYTFYAFCEIFDVSKTDHKIINCDATLEYTDLIEDDDQGFLVNEVMDE